MGSTLKALASFSPGLRSGNPGKEISFVLRATLKESVGLLFLSAQILMIE